MVKTATRKILLALTVVALLFSGVFALSACGKKDKKTPDPENLSVLNTKETEVEVTDGHNLSNHTLTLNWNETKARYELTGFYSPREEAPEIMQAMFGDAKEDAEQNVIPDGYVALVISAEKGAEVKNGNRVLSGEPDNTTETTDEYYLVLRVNEDATEWKYSVAGKEYTIALDLEAYTLNPNVLTAATAETNLDGNGLHPTVAQDFQVVWNGETCEYELTGSWTEWEEGNTGVRQWFGSESTKREGYVAIVVTAPLEATVDFGSADGEIGPTLTREEADATNEVATYNFVLAVGKLGDEAARTSYHISVTNGEDTVVYTLNLTGLTAPVAD